MSLFRSGLIVSSLTLLSRIFGVFRELLVASTFGTTDIADSFNIAIRFPSLFRRIFGEGALSSVFIPIYNHKKLQSKQDAIFFANNIFIILAIILILLTIVFIFFMKQIIYVLSPGFYSNSSKMNLSVLLCKITMPYLIFICLVGLIGGILNSEKKFVAFAAFPILLSVTLSIFVLINPDPIFVCIGTNVAGVLQLIFMFGALKLTGINLKIIIPRINEDVRIFLRKMVPAVISASTTQINLFISQSISSFIPSVISILTYSERIYQLPLSIIGTTLGTILLPELSSIKDDQKSNEIKKKSLKFCVLFSVPCMLGIFVLSEQIIHVIYERGAFTRLDTIKTAQVIAIFAIAIPTFIINKVYSAIFFAKMDTKTPMKIIIYSVILNAVLNIIFVYFLKHIGIALGTMLSSYISSYIYHKQAISRKYLKLDNEVIKFYIKSLFSGFIMYFVVYIIRDKIFNFEDGFILKILYLILLIFIGIVSYVTSLFMLKTKKNY